MVLQVRWLDVHTAHTCTNKTHISTCTIWPTPLAETDTAGQPLRLWHVGSMPTALRPSSHPIAQHLLWQTAPISLCLMLPEHACMDALSCKNTYTHPLQKAHWKWMILHGKYSLKLPIYLTSEVSLISVIWQVSLLKKKKPQNFLLYFNRSFHLCFYFHQGSRFINGAVFLFLPPLILWSSISLGHLDIMPNTWHADMLLSSVGQCLQC